MKSETQDTRTTIQKKVLFFLFICLSIFIYFIVLRSLYTKPFQREFFNDLYDHSQYSIAQSYRGIGDATVYQVVGDRLVRGVSGIYDVDPQVPPLGKQIFGHSIKYFGNAYVQNFVVLAIVICGVYCLGKKILGSSSKALLFVVFAITDAIIVIQLKTTMLDLMQLALVMWYLYFLIVASEKGSDNKARYGLFLICGLLLGVMASVKFGLLVPLLLLISLIWIFFGVHKTQKASEGKQLAKVFVNILVCGVVMSAGALVGLSLGHSSYFFEKDSNLVSFIKNEKWVITHWLQSSNTQKNPLMIFVFELTGFYKHFTSNAKWEAAYDNWNPLWPIGISGWILFVRQLIKDRVSVDTNKLLILLTMPGIMVMYSFIPFYPRYLVHISPLILLGIFLIPYKSYNFTASKIYGIVIVVVTILFLRNIFLLYEQPHGVINDYKRFSEQKLYKDVFEKSVFVDNSISFGDFWKNIYGAEYGLGKYDVKTELDGKIKLTMPWDSKISVPYRKTYVTEVGNITFVGELSLVRDGILWKIEWHDDYVHPKFEMGDKFVLETDKNVNFGTYYDEKGIAKIVRKSDPYVVVYPDRIEDENAVYGFAKKYMDLSQFRLEEFYKVNHPDHLPANIGFLPDNIDVDVLLPDGVVIELRERWVGEYPNVYSDLLGVQGGKVFLLKKDSRKILLLEKQTVQGVDVRL